MYITTFVGINFCACDNSHMGDLHINIDDSLKKRFKAACVLAERKMGDVVAELIEQWLLEQEQAQKKEPNKK